MGQISPFYGVNQLKKVIYGLSFDSSVVYPATLGTLSLDSWLWHDHLVSWCCCKLLQATTKLVKNICMKASKFKNGKKNHQPE
jgi:hypothetical protein